MHAPVVRRFRVGWINGHLLAHIAVRPFAKFQNDRRKLISNCRCGVVGVTRRRILRSGNVAIGGLLRAPGMNG